MLYPNRLYNSKTDHINDGPSSDSAHPITAPPRSAIISGIAEIINHL